ncbi:galactose oxidase-like domain-containing protein [Nocardia sp. NPDC101769]|uniref:galactose oxidase-like domain-containing protein n=1 Tax=Nocardia sp. NPDC101769 TaxID=3364333 RepID=UPI003823A378
MPNRCAARANRRNSATILEDTTGSLRIPVSLVRAGAATHTIDNDQRRIPLTVTGTSGTAYQLLKCEWLRGCRLVHMNPSGR